MTALLIPRTIAFQVDAELDSVLNNLSNDDLDGFAEIHSNLTSFNEIKLSIYASVLKFRRTGLIKYLEEAKLRAKGWVQTTPDHHPERDLQLRILVQIFGEDTRQRLESTWPVLANNLVLSDRSIQNEIVYAIEVATTALALTPRDHPDRVAISNDLAAWFAMQFKWTSDLQHIHSAIEVANDALILTPLDHPYRYMVLTNLGSWIYLRYKRTGSLEDLYQTTELAREALQKTPDSHHEKAMALLNLGSRLDARFQNTGQIADLHDAIEVGDKLLQIMSEDHPELPNALINIAARRGRLFEQTTSMADLDIAVRFAKEALHIMPEDHEARSEADRNLHRLLSMQFDLLGFTDDGAIPKSDAGPSSTETPLGALKTDTRLDFRLSPPISEVKRVVGIANPEESGKRFEGECRVYWDILEFYKQELEPGSRLHTVVTVTGTPACAEMSTCEAFERKIWGSSSLIEFLDATFRDPAKINDPFELYEDCCISNQGLVDDSKPDAPYTCFSLSGPEFEVAQLLQELAWLTAAFTLPTKHVLTIATATLKVVRPGLVEIKAEKLEYEDTDADANVLTMTSSCWHRLARGATLAYGFPISKREDGVGLEIPFDLMTSLAGIRTQMDVGEAANLLLGPGIVLYPTKVWEKGVQWHLAGVDEYDYTTDLKKYDLHKFSKKRTFLGYFTEAEVLLGTEDLVMSHTGKILRSTSRDATTQIEFANEGTFSSGLSIKSIFTLNLTAKYQVSKTLRISLQGRTYLDMVDEAQKQPIIIYDAETKSAWLVSELSAALHIALLYLSDPHIKERRQLGSQTLDGNWPLLPYANPSVHGFGAARRVCMLPENYQIKLWEEPGEIKTFADVIQGILRDFQDLRDGLSVQRRATPIPFQRLGLRGWEYDDILSRRRRISQKEVPNKDHAASWWGLGDADDVLVLLGRGFGPLISPKPESKNPMRPEKIVPGSRLLIAMKPCIDALRPDGRSSFSIGSLQWTSAQSLPPSCNIYCNKSCRCIQILKKRSFHLLQQNLNEPRREVLRAQAVIFGDSEHYHNALKLQHIELLRLAILRFANTALHS
ncbi:hypothetical protein QQS21_011252 [Conoideocrella luteorostrata]|uniref:Uncharacterized protein n=1 Tax=Conoideocrella luteorostrata TaxID=1105319 RepID=A0AAJ0FNJ8_9HYPO|nr:hypothetical protein QQS21_011252 [Conoideocrella luteorostrata]